MFILLLSGSAQSWINTVNIVSGCQLFAQPLRVTGRSYEPITQGACTDHQRVPVPRDMDAQAKPGPSGGCANSWHPLEMLTENYHCILLNGPILIEARWTSLIDTFTIKPIDADNCVIFRSHFSQCRAPDPEWQIAGRPLLFEAPKLISCLRNLGWKSEEKI